MASFDPYNEIEQEGIELLYQHLPPPVQGLYFRLDGLSVIIVDSRLSPREERCVLAEELGHHYLTVGNNVRPYYSLKDSLEVCREELRALKWALAHLIDDGELDRLLHKGLTLPELADHFQVTEHIMESKLALRSSRG